MGFSARYLLVLCCCCLERLTCLSWLVFGSRSKQLVMVIFRVQEPQLILESSERLKKGLNIINHNWQVICVGFLFGLGFDTATQIAVLATSAVATSKGIPWFAVFSFPILFTSGMCLMDTSDGLFMSTAYSWVFSSPFRKVYYNLALTGLSVTAAFFCWYRGCLTGHWRLS